jgi:hypothetical protein
VILDEAVLHREVGGAAVMQAQLDRLVMMSERPNVSTRIIPYSAGAHPAMDSTFNILEFAGTVPTVVYVEGLVGWIYVERPQDVARYRQVFEHLRTVALTSRESVALLREIGAHHGSSAIRAAPGDVRS